MLSQSSDPVLLRRDLSSAVVPHLVKKMADGSLLMQVRYLQEQVAALSGLREVVEEQREVIRVLRSQLEAQGPVSLTLRRDTESQGAWQVVRGNGKKALRKAPVTPPPETRNSFSVLRDECEGAASEGEKTDETTPSSGKPEVEGKVVVVGDSQVRGLGRVFCARDSERRMCVCLPGAGVGDVSDRLGGALASEGVAPTVVFSVGGNDVGRVRDEEIVRRYRVALGKVRDLGGVPVVCGVLPRKYAGGEWLTQACALNSRLADLCRGNGWLFVDNWCYFFGRDHLYSRDGVHLSERGTGALAWSLQRDLGRWVFLERV